MLLTMEGIPEETQYYEPQDHPWIEMFDEPADEDTMVIRFSLDEIRLG